MTEASNTITLRLPWPAQALRPNARGAWYVKEADRKAAKQTGEYAMRDALLDGRYNCPDRLQMTVTFHPPSNRHYDLDNFHAALKHYLDGAFARLGRDDSTVDQVLLRRGKPLKGGSVTVILGEVEN